MSLKPLALGAAAIVWVGCTPTVYSPPTRFVPIESAATLPPEQFGVQLEGGISGRVFGPSLGSGSLRLRSGLTEQLEISGELSVLHVVEQGAVEQHPNVYAARAGVRFGATPWFSIAFGAGGGGSAGGGFVGPDTAAHVAWENPYLVPFFALRAGASVPFAAAAVDVSSDEPGTDVFAPEISGWVAGNAGLRLPIGDEKRDSLAISAGVQLAHAFDDDSGDSFAGLGVAVEGLLR